MPNLFIDGAWTAGSGGTAEVVNPFDASVVEVVEQAGPAEVDAAVAAARRAFDDGPWPRTPVAERAALLRRVAELLVRDKEEIARTETLDTGKTLGESRIDVDDVVAVFRYYADLADKDSGRIVDVGQAHVVSKVVPVPVGVCVLITPWNYPLLQLSWKVAPCLAAGNTCVIKPSEITPLTSVLLVRLIEEAGAPRGDLAADWALTAVFLHAGQVCSAGARLIVEDALHDDLVAEIARRAERIRIGNGFDEASESGPLVSAAHRARIEDFVASAQAEGARLVAGGRRPEEPELQKGFFYRPTVFADCTRDMRVIREETFGPILTFERFGTEADAIALGNDTDYGLAGAVWTQDMARAHRVASALRHGTVWINDYHPYVPGAEWGGIGASGNGRELGPTGLAEYQELKHVWHNTAPEPMRWFKG